MLLSLTNTSEEQKQLYKDNFRIQWDIYIFYKIHWGKEKKTTLPG